MSKASPSLESVVPGRTAPQPMIPAVAGDQPARRRKSLPSPSKTTDKAIIEEVTKAYSALPKVRKEAIKDAMGDLDALFSAGITSIIDDEKKTRIITKDGIGLLYSTTFEYRMKDGKVSTLSVTVSPEGDIEEHVSRREAQLKVKTSTDAAPKRQASRVNKAQFNFWLDPEFKRSMLAVKIQDPARSLESIYAEAFNDLFRKYKVPTVPNTEGTSVGKPRGPNRSPGG